MLNPRRRWNLCAAAFLLVTLAVTACGPQSSTTVPIATPAPTGTPAFGPIVATPPSLLFAALGAANAQVVTLSEQGYTGAFSLRTTCTVVSAAVISEASYAITPLANGTCSLTFLDSNGQSVNVPVTVSTTATPAPSPSASPSTSPSAAPGFGPIVASPISFAFLGTGAPLAQTLTLSETGYAGAFSLRAGCTQAAVNQITNTTFSIAPASFGSCTLSFGDANGQTIIVPVVVTVTNGGGQ
jgi:hypothetical protein